MIELGQCVGNYKVTAKLGEGGMGVVYLVEHPVIGRKAALKAIHPEYARDLEVVSRFVTEAKSLNEIGHEHIVDITDFGTTSSGDFYFVMEYLEGASLAETLHKETRLSPGRAVRIASQTADALQASHDHGVIHRDLKPDNIILVAQGGEAEFVKVLDFGLAKLVGREAAPMRNTRRGALAGTPFYMAPEQCEGKVEIDHRADVYSLGVMLFEMLTGERPFGGTGHGEVILKHMTMPPPAARSIVPSLPRALDVLLRRALAKDPARRFQSMAELRAALLDPECLVGSLDAAPDTDDEVVAVVRTHPVRRLLLGTFASIALLAAATHERPLARAVTVAAVLSRPAMARLESAARALGRPATVRVNFSSDPGGSTVARVDGTVLGQTPLSTEVPYADVSTEYIIRKAGYQEKVIAIIPNLPSAVFAFLEKDEDLSDPPVVVEQDAAQLAADDQPASGAPRTRHRARAPHPTALIDEDETLAPTGLAP